MNETQKAQILDGYESWIDWCITMASQRFDPELGAEVEENAWNEIAKMNQKIKDLEKERDEWQESCRILTDRRLY